MPALISTTSSSSAPSPEPEVYVDFELRAGVFHLLVGNAGAIPAHAVRISFTPTIRWADKKNPFARLTLFQHLEFLAPGRTFVGVVDDLPSFFRLNPITKFIFKITYQDQGGRAFKRTITHDLSIYANWPAPVDRPS